MEAFTISMKDSGLYRGQEVSYKKGLPRKFKTCRSQFCILGRWCYLLLHWMVKELRIRLVRKLLQTSMKQTESPWHECPAAVRVERKKVWETQGGISPWIWWLVSCKGWERSRRFYCFSVESLLFSSSVFWGLPTLLKNWGMTERKELFFWGPTMRQSLPSYFINCFIYSSWLLS